MNRRLRIPGEREEAALIAACEQAAEMSLNAVPDESWPEPGCYLAVDSILAGLPADQGALDALWRLQNPDRGFPARWGEASTIDSSARVWAAMRLAGVQTAPVSKLGAAVRSMGGVDAVDEITRLEWALLGLIPADRVEPESSPAAVVLCGGPRAGGPQRALDLGEIGGCGQPAGRQAGRLKAWWARVAGAGSCNRAVDKALEDCERTARSGSILDPRVRTAWLAAVWAGRSPGALRSDPDPGHEDRFQQGVDATLRMQESDGRWEDSEGAIHGTWRALAALRRDGYDDHEAEVLRGGEWLRSSQNADGGWGEGAASTISHTAWALMGLLQGGDPASESVTKGVEYLLRAQHAPAAWRERAWTRTCLKGLAYARDEARANADARRAIEEFMQAAKRGINE